MSSEYNTYNIEDYDFAHGLHRDLVTGKFLPLAPHKFDPIRPLTHPEMHYNMLYMEQTMGGYRIYGSGTDGALNTDDLTLGLLLHEITQDPDDQVYIDAGFSVGQYIWIPGCCDGSTACQLSLTIASVTNASFGNTDGSFTITANNVAGTLSFSGTSITPTQNGQQYTFSGVAPGIYTLIATDNANSCTDTIAIAVGEEADPCAGIYLDVEEIFADAGLDSGSILVQPGGITDPTPTFTLSPTVAGATYTDNGNGTWTIANLPADTYTITLSADEGIVTCTETATAVVPSQANQTWYYFHGWSDLTAVPFAGDLTTSPTYYLDDGTGGYIASTLSDVMTELIDNEPGDYTMQTFEMQYPITNNNNQTILNFPATTVGGYYYIAIPDNAAFPEDLTFDQLMQWPSSATGGGTVVAAFERKAFTYNGEDYWLYRLPGTGSTAQRYVAFI
jgi:hypothetical protein